MRNDKKKRREKGKRKEKENGKEGRVQNFKVFLLFNLIGSLEKRGKKRNYELHTVQLFQFFKLRKYSINQERTLLF